MAWWGLASCKVGDLYQLKGKLNQTVYHSILQSHTIPSGTWLVGQGFVHIYDNDPKQTSRFGQKYLKSNEEQYVLHLISWPAQSADLNPIKLVWNEIE